MKREERKMNKSSVSKLPWITAWALALALITMTSCTKQSGTATRLQTSSESGQTILDPNFSIYGVWRYVGSADVEHDETWVDDGTDLITLYDDNGKCVIAIRNSIYYGLMYKRDGYSHQY